MAERQALGIDINEWSRTGGINYDLVNKHFLAGVYDFLIIKAGLGKAKSVLLDEQKKNIERLGIPYTTYHFLDPREDMRVQARRYVDWVGTGETVYIVDVEQNEVALIDPPTRGDLLRNIDELVKLTNKVPVIYSRMNILQQIGFVNDAKQFPLWIAQYLWDRSLLPEKKVGYQYFHDFTRDHVEKIPPDVRDPVLKDNVILWQFTKKGNGPFYIYNLRTAHSIHKEGAKEADLNISIKGRSEFLKFIFGGVPSIVAIEDNDDEQEELPRDPTFSGMTNQQMINLIYKAARAFTDDPWLEWIVRAKLEFMAIPDNNRQKPYIGPRIEDLPNLTQEEKSAILTEMTTIGNENQSDRPTYLGMTNQHIINLIFKAAGPFTNDPWKDWVLRADLEFLAVPEANRRKPYTGLRIEELPNLTDEEKDAIFEVM